MIDKHKYNNIYTSARNYVLFETSMGKKIWDVDGVKIKTVAFQ